MLILLQTLIYLLGVLFSGFLLIKGWLTQAVWSKDCSQGLLVNLTQINSWMYKTEKNKNPEWYWKFMGFYGFIFFVFLLLLIF
jgi:hypothetical protein